MRKLCTLLVAALIACLGLATVAKAATQTIEAETFTLNPSSAGMVQNNASASGGKELWVWSNATASKSVTHDEVAKVTVRARAQLCGTAAPRVEIRVDGNAVGAVNVSSTSFADYTANVNIPAGTHQLGLAFTNDTGTSTCDRNVLLDKVTLEGPASDTTAPDTSISSGPAEGSTDTDGNVSFGFSGTDNVGVTAFECSNVSAGQADNFTSCTSPKAYNGLANGNYTFKVRAKDAANNTDATPAIRNYTVSTGGGTPYSVAHEAESFTFNPSSAGMGVNNANASGTQELWVWSNATASKSVTLQQVDKVTVRARGQLCGSEAPRLEIRVGGTAVGSVNVSSTPFADYAVNVNIPAGTHQLGLAYTNDVRTSTCDRNVLVDKVTLEGASSDTTAPDTSISSGPAEGSTDTDGNVSFGFSGTDNVGVTGFECSNVAQGQADNFTSCTSPKAYSGLANGSYTFKVRARDAANNTDQSPATRNYAVNVSSGASAISLGVYNGSMYNQGATGGFDTEAQLLGRSPKVFMWYPNAAQHWPFETAKANYAKNQHGADIHLTWEWFNTSYSSITAGQHDAYIRQYARDAAAYGDPILMRMFHEMNGNWYSWSLSSDSVADNHKAAWQHIVTIFRQEGATNVKFFWCPNDGGDYDARLQRAWPGDEYVDVVGVDSYNGPPSWADPRSAEGMFRAKYNFFYNTLGSQRPFAIGETNSREATSYPGGKDQWVTDVMNQLTDGSWPKLIHVTIFDDNYGGYNDWRINSFQTALDAYKAWYADPRYQGTLP